MEDTKVYLLVLIEFSNAFNTVSREILLATLTYLMVSSEALEWFNLSSGTCSCWWLYIELVRPLAGGIIASLLFSIFINLTTQQLHGQYHLYTDDLVRSQPGLKSHKVVLYAIWTIG